MKKDIQHVFQFARVEELIAHGDEDKLVMLVMRLTRGTVNPKWVIGTIQEIKSDAKLEAHWASQLTERARPAE